MISAMECCTIGFNDESNAISYLKTNGSNSLLYPETVRAEAMKAYHDNSAGGAHLGIEKVMAAMKSKYHWLRMH